MSFCLFPRCLLQVRSVWVLNVETRRLHCVNNVLYKEQVFKKPIFPSWSVPCWGSCSTCRGPQRLKGPQWIWSIAQVKNLLSTAVNRGGLWTLNYTKFDGDTPSPFPSLDPSDVTFRLPRGPRSTPDLVPPLFKPETEKYYYRFL